MKEKIISEIKTIIEQAYKNGGLSKLKLSGKRNPEADSVKEVVVRLIEIRSNLKFKFVYKYPTKDITKNHTLANALSLIESLLCEEFKYLSILRQAGTYQVDAVKWKSHGSQNQVSNSKQKAHDNIKSALINPDAPYLKELGIAGKNGLKNEGKKKFRQINKYIEIVSPLLNDLDLSSTRIIDMGCGKGYLTFALYDYLKNKLGSATQIQGVEIRKELVTSSNSLAERCGFKELKFVESSIQDYKMDGKVLIALHACDTATDDALSKGIESRTELIICSPCCHKQVRKDMRPESTFKSLNSYGIIQERQAELLTDTIRALILNLHGYKTKIIEFISTEHTPKNLLLIGQKHSSPTPDEKENILLEIQTLKKTFGLSRHYLEDILNKN